MKILRTALTDCISSFATAKTMITVRNLQTKPIPGKKMHLGTNKLLDHSSLNIFNFKYEIAF